MGFLAADVWRKKPFLMRGIFRRSDLAHIDKAAFSGWLNYLSHIRVFVDDCQSENESSKVARLVPNSDAQRIFEKLCGAGCRFTVLANGIDKIDKSVVNIRTSLSVPHVWRTDDIVVTYSTVGSGIGYHAGHEDAVIVQANGKREWCVWNDSEISDELRRRILLGHINDIYSFKKTLSPPVLKCLLEPGDALYIPPFFPHNGLTVETSVSIAVGWRGIAPFHLYYAFLECFEEEQEKFIEDQASLFHLIDDFNPEKGDTELSEFVDKVILLLKAGNLRIRDEIKLSKQIHRLLSTGSLAVA